MAKILTCADYRLMTWRNGGGSTLELYKIAVPKDPERFLFRISIATVSVSGPFSLFPNIHRHLLLLKGAGFKLNFTGGKSISLDQPLIPVQFEGEESIDCHLLAGESIDFNVMTDRTWGQSRLTIFPYKTYIKLCEPESIFLYFINDQKLVILGPDESYTLQSTGPVIKISVSII